MVHVDLNPVSVETDYKHEVVTSYYKSGKKKGQVKGTYNVTYTRLVVYAHYVEIYAEPWQEGYRYDDYDTKALQSEWRNKWEQFLGESFKKWAEQNDSREEE